MSPIPYWPPGPIPQVNYLRHDAYMGDLARVGGKVMMFTGRQWVDVDELWNRRGNRMTYQEILEGITKHRVNLVQIKMDPYGQVVGESLRKKIEEIEWALQALTEKLAAGDKE